MREINKEQEERKMPVEMKGRSPEQETDRKRYLEVKQERTGRRGKHTVRAEGKKWMDWWRAGRKVQKTERRGEKELKGESKGRGECCCCFWEGCTVRC